MEVADFLFGITDKIIFKYIVHFRLLIDSIENIKFIRFDENRFHYFFYFSVEQEGRGRFDLDLDIWNTVLESWLSEKNSLKELESLGMRFAQVNVVNVVLIVFN